MQTTKEQTKHKVTAREMNEVSQVLRDSGYTALANDCRTKAADAAVNTGGILHVEYGPVLREILRSRGEVGKQQLKAIKEELGEL